MFRSKSILSTLLAVCGLAFVSAVTVHAQWNQGPEMQRHMTNNPCANWKISWALNQESAFNTSRGGVDCDLSNYGTWRTEADLMANLRNYRASLVRQNVTLSAPALAANRHMIQSVMKNGTMVYAIDYGLVASGGGNLVASGGGNLVATGGGNILSPNSANIALNSGANIALNSGANLVASGGGNFYGVQAEGDTIVQFPGKWVKISTVSSSASGTNDFVPLKLYWNASRNDTLTTATPEGIQAATSGGYTFVRIEGYVFKTQKTGTVALKLYYSPQRDDYFTVGTPEGEAAAKTAGYAYIRTEGYVYPTQQIGTTPLKKYYKSSTGDNFSTASSIGERDATGAGYTYYGIEGYVLINP